MRIYNSLSNEVEDFKTIEENKVSMYVCGPTVYNDPHIGNARPLIVFDMVYRVLMALGYDVKYVSNYTDIDDKIIDKAISEGVSSEEISERYIEAYEKLSRDLNVLSPTKIKVTETMSEIISFIKQLIDDGYAYEINGDVYFRVSKVDDYGKLSKQKVDDLLVGARIEENTLKENPLDFTLWKKTTVGKTFESPWSDGRPGWHTECVVMINDSFNQGTIDIHGGGLDLKFPHHENEMAQAHTHDESLANYWMHNGLINVDGKKMSKSSGAMILAKDMVSEYGYDLVRWLMLSTHYRAPLKLSDEYIKSSQTELSKIYTALNQAHNQAVLTGYQWTNDFDEGSYQDYLKQFENDFNTSNAYKVIFDTVKVLNASLRQREIEYNHVNEVSNSIVKMLSVLGIDYEFQDLKREDIEMYGAWKQAHKDKNYDLADELRKQLMAKGML